MDMDENEGERGIDEDRKRDGRVRERWIWMRVRGREV
jgi:hypothetical protein